MRYGPYGGLYAGLCPESLAAIVEYDRNDVAGILAVINCSYAARLRYKAETLSPGGATYVISHGVLTVLCIL